jgi:putative membrane protein
MQIPMLDAAEKTPVQMEIRHRTLRRALLAFYLVLWVVTAIAPRYRFDWFLEQLLVFAFAIFLATTHSRLRFSTGAYVLMTVFLSLHTIGAHYTYSETPIGVWMQDLFGFERNHYDRVVHFSFGVLMYHPLREIARRAAGIRTAWSYVFAFTAVLTFSAIYEIMEWCVAVIVSPEAALAYLGTQGDVFDAQKDAALAATGAILGGLLSASFGRIIRRRAGGAGEP